MSSPSYRDDRDAALARAAALQRENQHLRAENVWLRGQVDPPPPDHALAHYRGAAVGAMLLLGAMGGAGVIASETEGNLSRADATDLTCAADAQEPPFTDSSARMALGERLPERAPVAPPELPALLSPPPPRAPLAVMNLALTPLLQGCFNAPRERADVLAAVDARGHVRRASVLVARRSARSLRAETRCVRRALGSVTLPTTTAAYASYGPNVELYLFVLAAPPGRRRHHG